MILFYVSYRCLKVIHERERVPEAEIKNCLLSDLAAKWSLCEYTLHPTRDALPERTSEYLKRGTIFPDSNVMLMTSVWPWVDEFPFEKYQPFYGASVRKSPTYIQQFKPAFNQN